LAGVSSNPQQQQQQISAGLSEQQLLDLLYAKQEQELGASAQQQQQQQNEPDSEAQQLLDLLYAAQEEQQHLQLSEEELLDLLYVKDEQQQQQQEALLQLSPGAATAEAADATLEARPAAAQAAAVTAGLGAPSAAIQKVKRGGKGAEAAYEAVDGTRIWLKVRKTSYFSCHCRSDVAALPCFKHFIRWGVKHVILWGG
jgi:hypothetical protein